VPSPQTILPWLLGGAIGAAGILQGLHWRSSSPLVHQSGLEDQLRIASDENEMLRRENDSLRSLAQGGGELAVPQELVDRVEREFSLRFKSNPIVHRAGSQELHDRISAALENSYGPSGIDDRQEAYHLIGWLQPGTNLLDQLTAVHFSRNRSWFDEATGEAWVTERYDIKNIPDQAILLRLLSRILFHQHFPPAETYSGDDAARARNALHEGAGAGFEARFYAEAARTIGFLPTQQNREDQQLLDSLPPFFRGLLKFSSVEGKQRTDLLFQQGNENLLDQFKNPPQTTRAVVYPNSADAGPIALDLPEVPEKPFLTESAGLLGLSLWLETQGDQEIASHWKNDRYVLFPDGEDSLALLWDIELATQEATDQLQTSALKIISSMAGLKESAILAKIITSSEQRNLIVTRISPTRIRFLNTFLPATATAIYDQ
jgi:hypothetical protein